MTILYLWRRDVAADVVTVLLVVFPVNFLLLALLIFLPVPLHCCGVELIVALIVQFLLLVLQFFYFAYLTQMFFFFMFNIVTVAILSI